MTQAETQEEKSGGWLRIVLFLIFAAVAIYICANVFGGVGGDTVILDHPINTTVQMFDANGNFIRNFYNGEKCRILGTFKWVEGGSEIPLYKVDCDGVIGYVNRRFTR